jgi:hypothetical protein
MMAAPTTAPITAPAMAPALGLDLLLPVSAASWGLLPGPASTARVLVSLGGKGSTSGPAGGSVM